MNRNKCDLRKITPVNGFDPYNRDNARQNNYAWSMAEFGGYLYVGTGRNIVYSTMAGLGVDVPPELTPQNPSNRAEIWRYPLGGSFKKWERVYQAPEGSGIMGFRYMIVYAGGGTPVLYCAAFGVNVTNPLLMTGNGLDFAEIPGGMPEGFSTRAMAIHNGRLYSGATNAIDFSPTSWLFATDNPQNGWTQIDFGPGEIPTGEVVSLISFNGYLYIGTSPAGGFEVWKSATPESGGWVRVVDKGAGDALNEVPMSMEIYRDHLYVGTGIWVGLQSVDPDKRIVPPKGFDVIRIDKNDCWELVVGSTPIAPTSPTTGTRNRARIPSGFGSIFNAYCWQICAFDDTLFIGTWDSAVLWNSIIRNMLVNRIEENEDSVTDEGFSLDNVLRAFSSFAVDVGSQYNWFAWIRALVRSIPKYPRQFGFDLFASCDGEAFTPVTLDGLCNPYNYGLRTLVVTMDKQSMFLGTANPFEGCEVWRMTERFISGSGQWDCCCK